MLNKLKDTFFLKIENDFGGRHHLPPSVVRSLCSGARYSLGLVPVPLLGNGTGTRLPPDVVTHSTALMEFRSQKRYFEMYPS